MIDIIFFQYVCRAFGKKKTNDDDKKTKKHVSTHDHHSTGGSNMRRNLLDVPGVWVEVRGNKGVKKPELVLLGEPLFGNIFSQKRFKRPLRSHLGTGLAKLLPTGAHLHPSRL